MPEFDDNTEPQGPKRKPRKPMKKRRKMRKARTPQSLSESINHGIPKKRRGRPAGSKANGHIGKRYTKEQYEAINSLLGMTAKERDAVLDIVKGLAK